MMIAIALSAWIVLLLLVVGLCAAARTGEAASVDTVEAGSAPEPRLRAAREALLRFERAA
jgi:hypothetical protein